MSNFWKTLQILLIVAIIAGVLVYKLAPAKWQLIQDKITSIIKPGAAKKGDAKDEAPAPSKQNLPPKPTVVIQTGHASNENDLSDASVADFKFGTVLLTNRHQTIFSLGKGTNCILSPKLGQSNTIAITIEVECKDSKGKIRDMSMTEAIVPIGKPMNAAVGGFSFSLTPKVAAE